MKEDTRGEGKAVLVPIGKMPRSSSNTRCKARRPHRQRGPHKQGQHLGWQNTDLDTVVQKDWACTPAIYWPWRLAQQLAR